jgi:small subunit ribosomal protein S3Ae
METKKKAKGKQWVAVVAPAMFKNREIAEVPVSDPEKLVGKRIASTLIELADDFSKYYMKLSFKISKLEGGRALTEFDGLECLQDYVSRMVHKHGRRVDTVQDLTTKDGRKVRVKTVAIIPRRVKSSIKVAVRNRIIETVGQAVAKGTVEDFVDSILKDEVKQNVLAETRKIYPIRSFEVRKLEIKS